MQKEITTVQPLHDENGHLANPGYAKKPLWTYDRSKIKAGKSRIKEWDYYLIHNDEYGIAFTIADNSYLGFVSVSLLNFKERKYDMFSTLIPFTWGKLKMPPSSSEGDVIFENKKIKLSYKHKGGGRKIHCDIPSFKNDTSLKASIELTDEPEESIVIATPFKEKKTAFYYNQKINCMKANGTVVVGDDRYEFKDAFGTLDWGRGVWTYDNTWFWGTASGKINDKPFGINIGYGFGDLSNATENMIFFDGKAHKFDQVEFVIPRTEKDKYDYMKNWEFRSNDGRLTLSFQPILDRADRINLGLILSDQHQVFGYMNGHVVLDDGTRLEVKNLLGSAEVVHNKW